MKKTVVLVTVLLTLQGVARANPSISYDFQNMMQWLTHETVQGLAFNTGSTYDPPDELAPGRWQPDASIGVGVVPLDKSKFPTITTPALADMGPAGAMPNQVTFPNFVVHMRMGLPNRWDLSIRGADMTIPDGYNLSSQTRIDKRGGFFSNGPSAQSNSLGFGIRKHLFGGDAPKLSLAANFNHVFGHINFVNQYNNLQLAPDFVVNSINRGQLDWDVTSIGLNAVTSETFGAWTPFLGFGVNRMSGSVSGKLTADFGTPLIINPEGQASSTPEAFQGRLIFGTEWGRSVLSYFLNGEVKVIGESAGRTFTVTTGVAMPFGVGGESGMARGSHHSSTKMASNWDSPPTDLRDAPNDLRGRSTGLEIDDDARPVPVMRYREFDKPQQPDVDSLDQLPEATLIR